MDKITGDISPIKKINGETLSDNKINGNIINNQKISGNISSTNRMNGNIRSAQKIKGNITYGNGGDVSIPIYNDEYEVIPLAFQETVLDTTGKYMQRDIIIKEIPYYETSNLGGGITVYIAGQIEFG